MSEFWHRYHTQGTGEWYSAGMSGWVAVPVTEYEVVTLWDDDTPLATVLHSEIDPGRHTYTITDHDMPDGSFTEEDLAGWRDWRAALEFATGTKRDEWDKD